MMMHSSRTWPPVMTFQREWINAILEHVAKHDNVSKIVTSLKFNVVLSFAQVVDSLRRTSGCLRGHFIVSEYFQYYFVQDEDGQRSRSDALQHGQTIFLQSCLQNSA